MVVVEAELFVDLLAEVNQFGGVVQFIEFGEFLYLYQTGLNVLNAVGGFDENELLGGILVTEKLEFHDSLVGLSAEEAGVLKSGKFDQLLGVSH